MKLRSPRWLARSLVMSGLAMVIGSTISLAGSMMPASALSSYGVSDDTTSAVTIRWSDQHDQASDLADPNYSAFRNIQVHVNQTRSLTHQGITVTWSGARPTSQAKYATNYFQAMQCWGDVEIPTQCQFGAPAGTISDLTGYQNQTRVIDPAQDPAQGQRLSPDYALPPDGTTFAFPFVSPDGKSTFNTGELFSSSTSNEVSAAATAGDGTGIFNFEVQTGLEAPHLGCGQPDENKQPRSCTLVIVPRGSLDLDGNAPIDSAGRVSGSPLSYSAWKNRITIPLNFAPIGQSCAIGQDETRIVGSDMASVAMNSWQAGLCSSGHTFGFSRIGDAEARAQIGGKDLGAAHMGLVSGPADASAAYASQLDYVPVAQSALVIAYNIDYSLYRGTPNYGSKDGTKVHNLRLNQRLVAKLLTQSYPCDTPGVAAGNPAIAQNPRCLTLDPEFLQLNPEFSDFTQVEPQGLMVAFGNADAYAHVWSWIRANADAKAFIEGQADGWGMVVNPAYGALGLTEGEPSVSFPKADLHTNADASDVPPYGTLDMRPYFNSLDETGLRALRADGNVKTSWDPYKLPAPGAYVSNGPQSTGQRFSLALTDLATAYKYGLDVAALQGSVNGNFVEPTTASIQKAISNRVATSVSGMTAPDWSKSVADAYPLSEVTYGAVNVCAATTAERSAYAAFLKYVGRAGQVLSYEAGGLPYGYVPLPSSVQSTVNAVVADIVAPSDKATRCPDLATPVLPDSGGFDVVSGGAHGKKMFIAKPFYGSGETLDNIALISRVLTAGGYILGIPLLLIGYLVMRRQRNELPFKNS